MLAKLTPKQRRNLSRILPFGAIWLIAGWFVLFVETAATGSENLNPDTAITMGPEVFLFASIAVYLVGIIVGSIEVLWLGRLFERKSFGYKILYKTGFYLVFMLMVNVVTYPIAASLELGQPVTSAAVWLKFEHYLVSITFLSTMVSITFSLVLCLFYSEISEHLGHKVLMNLFTGRYHHPQEEDRIFMFVDLKSSTQWAENLGHDRYFKFLRDYYQSLSGAIVDHEAEVYQYVGDEIVLTWEAKKGLERLHCLDCFFAMKQAVHAKEHYFTLHYGGLPCFKAGLHMGKVTTGEIGALKKDIFFTGDVLNTTARIQSLCNSLGADLLVSETLNHQLKDMKKYQLKALGSMSLRGRKEPMSLYAVAKN